MVIICDNFLKSQLKYCSSIRSSGSCSIIVVYKSDVCKLLISLTKSIAERNCVILSKKGPRMELGED